MIQIKILETIYTPQDLQKAAIFGSEGFIQVNELDNGYFAFSKEFLYDHVIEEIQGIIESGDYSAGTTFYSEDIKYELI